MQIHLIVLGTIIMSGYFAFCKWKIAAMFPAECEGATMHCGGVCEFEQRCPKWENSQQWQSRETQQRIPSREGRWKHHLVDQLKNLAKNHPNNSKIQNLISNSVNQFSKQFRYIVSAFAIGYAFMGTKTLTFRKLLFLQFLQFPTFSACFYA